MKCNCCGIDTALISASLDKMEVSMQRAERLKFITEFALGIAVALAIMGWLV